MSFNLKNKLLENVKRQHLRGLAFALFWVSVGVLVWWFITFQSQTQGIPFVGDIPLATTTGDVLFAERSLPTRIRIPSIGISAVFEEPLGLAEDRSVNVPKSFETVGWYKNGPTPGEIGPSVVLGHVDSYQGPAVFWSLGQVSAGDRIEVDREDGSTAVFLVTGLERVEQSAFPTDRVYGNIPYAGIRLVTCSGTYIKGVQRYTHNLIVYGELVDVLYPENDTE